MVAVRRERDHGPAGESRLYADSSTAPFGGARHGSDGWTSWGPAGDTPRHPTRSSAELVQVVAYRAAHEPTIPPIAMPDLDPDADAGADAPDLDMLGDEYTDAFAALPGVGYARKKSGAHYTPESLVDALIDSTFTALVDEACDLPTRAQRVQALLALTISDPACGSGAFIVRAAQLLGYRLAVEVVGTVNPPAGLVADAIRQVVGRCVYGLDLAPSAAELAKLALWLTAFDPDRPNVYLDHKVRVGNGLVGGTPNLVAAGVPDDAFKPIEGDDPKTVTALRRRNAAERSAKDGLFGPPPIPVHNMDVVDGFAAVARTVADDPADVVVQRILDEGLRRCLDHRRLVADAWCAAFVQPKTPASVAAGEVVTQAVLERLAADPDSPDLASVVRMVREQARVYSFFHYHLEWPEIFPVAEGAAA